MTLETEGGVMPPTPASPALWDPLVRLTHWGVAIAVIANGLIDRPGSVTHVWVGWVLMALLLTRLLWGLIGPAEARFSAFRPDPVGAIRHMGHLGRALTGRGSVPEHRSHNPAGAMMVYALWALIAITCATGLIMTKGATPMQVAAEKAAVASGDWSTLAAQSDAGDDGAEAEGDGNIVQEVHDVAANLILILALVHVGGVVLESRALGRNLVRPMLTGDRTRRGS
ncbi:cytochrome b/b6 domain-containing protein [Paenirhodobacter sp.]|uniref:cytochrome b/b6 domain-containing protein n=1 Tax=Paenirhodobacter sp. TaxID=1965326 RepID=UPI003D0F67B5